MVLTRRLLLVLVGTFVLDNFTRPFLIGCVSIGFLVLNVHFSPYLNPITQHLEVELSCLLRHVRVF